MIWGLFGSTVRFILTHAARSDRGLVRAANKDIVFARRRLLAVADGMGGHPSGAITAQPTIDALAPLDTDPGPTHPATALHAAARTIANQVRAETALTDMGTTLVAILFGDNTFSLAYAGDNRAYLLRDGECTQITHDESFVQTLLDAGRTTPVQAAHHPQRAQILRAVTAEPIDPSLTGCAGDRFLLCSDGLTDVVDDTTLATSPAGPDIVADQLVGLALASGGPDNISVIVADLTDERHPSTPAAAGVADLDVHRLLGEAESAIRQRCSGSHSVDRS
ncbi:PP2C family protein-serine/threonine phosphatase [Nocardia tengchongensis]|uniref:PP2C family protein-serine/threonine phosphatase n=1 Tax=Nocardia tengchongensis TaxID=2055889 RepID=UPI00369E85E9